MSENDFRENSERDFAPRIIDSSELVFSEKGEHEDYAAVFERYDQYKAQGRIEFITFHQSYGYEEFIEGIKPVLSSADETSGEPGDIVLSCYSASTIDAVGVVTGEYEWHEEYSDYRRLRKVKWIVKGIRENVYIIESAL